MRERDDRPPLYGPRYQRTAFPRVRVWNISGPRRFSWPVELLLLPLRMLVSMAIILFLLTIVVIGSLIFLLSFWRAKRAYDKGKGQIIEGEYRIQDEREP